MLKKIWWLIWGPSTALLTRQRYTIVHATSLKGGSTYRLDMTTGETCVLMEKGGVPIWLPVLNPEDMGHILNGLMKDPVKKAQFQAEFENWKQEMAGAAPKSPQEAAPTPATPGTPDAANGSDDFFSVWNL